MKVDSMRTVDETETIYLSPTHWDDWFKYSTEYSVAYMDPNGKLHPLGHVKIGQQALQARGGGEERETGYRSPSVPRNFSRLGKEFFSVGQDPEFYENLNDFGYEFKNFVLTGLRDMAYLPDVMDMALQEDVTRVSLLRNASVITVTNQFRRIAQGGEKHTGFDFSFSIDNPKPEKPAILEIRVHPESVPPSNIHVLIGRNGVGKSTILNDLAVYLVAKSRDAQFSQSRISSPEDIKISNLISVSFSAFDAFVPISIPQDRTKQLTYHYVGLKKKDIKPEDSDFLKGPRALLSEMTKAVKTCLQGGRRSRWIDALKLLESDPIFASLELSDIIKESDFDDAVESIKQTFKKLSSGHKIVLLTITKLVETIEERSLVLLDEPEAHLHPPLLSAFTRSLSNLLSSRNGVALVATHSPVILQEVPSNCVWKMNRFGNETLLERPSCETFGENVGTLTHEVFGLEVESTGFYSILQNAAMIHDSYEEALNSIDHQVGSEGRAILRAMIHALNPLQAGRTN